MTSPCFDVKNLNFSHVYAAIALVTTGKATGRDKLLEIAICPFGGEADGELWTSTVQPNLSLPIEVQQLTGLHPSDLDRSPQFFQIAKRIIELTEGRTLVCQEPRMVYSFLKREFKDLGFTFQRPMLGLEKLVHEMLPDAESTSLPYLARTMEVPYTETHRAGGQAEGVRAVFEALLQRKAEEASPALKAMSRQALLPAGITPAILAGLPDAPGVYYFYDAAGEIIYVGKSVSIRKRVRSHFQIELDSAKAVEFKGAIARIDCTETGSELIALLHESEQIKRLGPMYNAALRARRYAYCLESYTDAKGYLNLRIERLSRAQNPHLPVSSTLAGKGLLFHLVEAYGLCQKLCGLYKTKGACFDFVLKKCQGACTGREEPEVYNARVLEALSRYTYPYKSFVILETGRTEGEVGVVWVDENQYRGYGFVQADAGTDLEILLACVEPKADDKDAQRIIRSYLAQEPEGNVIVY